MKASVVGPGISSASAATFPRAGRCGWNGSNASSANPTRRAPAAAACRVASSPRPTFSSLCGPACCWISAIRMPLSVSGREATRPARPASIMPGQLHALKPERLDLADDLLELVEVDGLGDVAVGMVLVAEIDVRLGGGRRQDDHRYALELGVLLDLPEDLVAVLAGQVQVQQHQIGPWRRRVGSFPAQERHGLDPVLDDVDLGLRVAPPKRH